MASESEKANEIEEAVILTEVNILYIFILERLRDIFFNAISLRVWIQTVFYM